MPSDAHIGTVRMRVRVQYKQNEGQGVCQNYESGETEDYDITLTADPNPNDGSDGSESLQPTAESAFVPVILTAAGRNQAFFTSELTLTNRGDQPATLDYTYTAAAGGGSGAGSDVLPAGRQKIVPDGIGYLKSRGIPIPEAGNRIGTLRVDFSGSVGVLARTTTAVPDGRAGLAYPGIPSEAGFQEAVYLCGLRQNSQDRSNVAFQNAGDASEGDITLRVTVFSGDPATPEGVALPEVTLAPGGFHQYSGILRIAGFDNGFVKVERVSGSGAYYAYGVINDQANSDGSFVFPVSASSLEGTRGQTLPVIVETGVFHSELTVTNFSEAVKTVNFSFVADGVQTDDHTATSRLTLEAGEQRIIPNVVNAWRRQGVEGMGSAGRLFAGAVFAAVEDGDMSGIVIAARTGSAGNTASSTMPCPTGRPSPTAPGLTACSRMQRIEATWPWSTAEKWMAATASSAWTFTTGTPACWSTPSAASGSRPGVGVRSIVFWPTTLREPARAMCRFRRYPATTPSWPTGSSTMAPLPDNGAGTAPTCQLGSRRELTGEKGDLDKQSED